jgi:hypothetical protein
VVRGWRSVDFLFFTLPAYNQVVFPVILVVLLKSVRAVVASSICQFEMSKSPPPCDQSDSDAGYHVVRANQRWFIPPQGKIAAAFFLTTVGSPIGRGGRFMDKVNLQAGRPSERSISCRQQGSSSWMEQFSVFTTVISVMDGSRF